MHSRGHELRKFLAPEVVFGSLIRDQAVLGVGFSTLGARTPNSDALIAQECKPSDCKKWT